MPKSEIDDIFASKGKAKAAPKVSESSSSTVKPEKKRKRKQKHKDESSIPADKVSVAETVIDPSIQAPSSKRLKVSKGGADNKAKSKKSDQDDEKFKDSRGTGPRRKTEEGWSVYKEDELGINDEGGDTPLCPFDCQCCF